ncbi:GIN domain-containing protein [Jiulongibacter sediminis]|jgi:hypothetical protein|uniref:GIN domain-containing protein n=1 Tax=Jiulongibacter sediminis TaxID=1605367 RepID=UPI0026EED16E|nr:DUF2807 domain-containing protein [Jiulongibacter sediminis]
MKKLLYLFLVLPLLQSCIYKNNWDKTPPGDLTEEIYNLDAFDEVALGSAFRVVIIPSTEFRLTANGVERDLDDLNVRVINRTLKVSYVNRNWLSGLSRDRMDLLIELPDLKVVDISGAANVEIEDFASFDLLEADVSGAAKLIIDVPMQEFKSDISGASDIELKQSVPLIRSDLSGASKLLAFDTNAKEVFLELSGASKANVSVSDYLNVSASGASTVNYRGTPRIDQEVSGGSKVKKG